MKTTLFLISAIVVGSVITAAAFLYQSSKAIPSEVSNLFTSTPEPAVTPTARVSPLAVATDMVGGGVATGTIEGKLCYPSSYLPQGIIEAKSVNNQTVVSEFYFGSENGGLSSYSLAVPEGTYVVRYRAQTDPNNQEYLNGYHTVECPTGMEDTCSQSERSLVEIDVVPNSIVTNIDLCDFYYGENEPLF